ncbi:MAG: Crp/Fnr family transcriptional regulator [Clostridia bacterium]|nr:Crp/Fnr family transcriptional regulator [Clostridia bacterium]
MKKYFDILRKSPLFNRIEDEDLTALLSCLGAKVCSYNKKETIMSEGEEAHEFGIVLFGSVQVIQIDYFGNRSIVSDVTPGEIFGEAFACAGESEIPVSVVANEACEVMFIDCNRAMHSCSNACEFHSKIIFNLMKIMALKNIMFHQKLQITSKRTTREKLLTYLMQQAKRNNSNSFEIPFDRQELADYLEVDRSGLSAEISKLRDEGIIESQKSRFRLL